METINILHIVLKRDLAWERPLLLNIKSDYSTQEIAGMKEEGA